MFLLYSNGLSHNFLYVRIYVLAHKTQENHEKSKTTTLENGIRD